MNSCTNIFPYIPPSITPIATLLNCVLRMLDRWTGELENFIQFIQSTFESHLEASMQVDVVRCATGLGGGGLPVFLHLCPFRAQNLSLSEMRPVEKAAEEEAERSLEQIEREAEASSEAAHV